MAPKVALLTGCSDPDSFGALLALELLSQGYRTFATARKIESVTGLKAAGCDVLALDVTKSESIRHAKDTIQELTGGRLDVLVNNAGIMGLCPTLDLDMDRFRDVMEVNVFGLLAVTQALAPFLIQSTDLVSKRTSGRSVVVNVCSSAAECGLAWEAAYGSSKAAARIISDHLRREMAGLKVRVITLEIGVMKSRMSQRAGLVDLVTSTRSSFYSNWPEIYADNFTDQLKRVKDFSAPKDLALTTARAISRENSAGRIWLGSSSRLFKWLWPCLPTIFADYLIAKLFRTNRVKAAC